VSEVYDELVDIVREGFWSIDAARAPRLTSLAVRTFGDPPSSGGLRRRLRRGMAQLAPAYEDAALTLFGVSEGAAGLSLGRRQEDAGQTAGLPRNQAPSTVRSKSGLQEFLVRRLIAYFEDGPLQETSDAAKGRGYINTRYSVAQARLSDAYEYDVTIAFTVEAYRPDVDLVTTGLHCRSTEMVAAEVLSPGHVKVGVRPATAASDGPLQLVIGLMNPLPVGQPVDLRIYERYSFDPTDPDHSLGINISRYPTAIDLCVSEPVDAVPRYERLHELRQINNRAMLGSEQVEREGRSPMYYHVEAAEPHTRYAIRWSQRYQ